MKKITVKRTTEGLVPIDEEGQLEFDRWDFGDTREISFGKKRTSAAHNAFNAFLYDCTANQEVHKTREDFLVSCCAAIGYGSSAPILDNEGNDTGLRYFTRSSFKFKEADQKKATEAYRRIYDHIKNTLGIDFDDWLQIGKKTQCDHPDCSKPAVHIHHIFPGSWGRKASEKYGFKVKLCHEHHDLSHGKGKNFEEAVTQGESMAKLWCQVIRVDYYVALQLVRK